MDERLTAMLKGVCAERVVGLFFWVHVEGKMAVRDLRCRGARGSGPQRPFSAARHHGLGCGSPVAMSLRRLPFTSMRQAFEQFSKHSKAGTSPLCVKRSSVLAPFSAISKTMSVFFHSSSFPTKAS